MEESKLSKWGLGILAWLVAVIIFFPIFIMIITAFKNEREAQSLSLFFLPTLESFYEVFARSNYLQYVLNSIFASIGSTLLCFALAIPAAYRMAFYPTKKTQSTLVWMLSTKMMPAVGVLIPLYILCQTFGLLDNIVALIIIYALINLPIAVWMAYTYFCEVPGAILEAARIDGATHLGRDVARPASHDAARSVFYRAAPDHSFLERGLLESEFDERKCGAAASLYCLLFQSGGIVLGEIVRGVLPGGGPDHGAGLDDAETACPRTDLWRGEIVHLLFWLMNDGSVHMKNLVKTYLDEHGNPSFTAVKGINLDIQDGEFMVLVGPSGCGKSTTLRMLAGLESISGGTISIGDRVVNKSAPQRSGHCDGLPELRALPPYDDLRQHGLWFEARQET